MSRGEPGPRLAKPADAEDIGRLLHDFNREYDEPTPEPGRLAERIATLMSAGDTDILLAGDPPVGVVVLRFREAIWTETPECYLAELYVVASERGRGFGRALMTAAIDLARGRGAVVIELGTGEDDLAARSLYESLGFSNREGRGEGPVNFYYELEL